MTAATQRFLEKVAAAGRRGLRAWTTRETVGANRRGYLEVREDATGRPIAIFLTKLGRKALREAKS